MKIFGMVRTFFSEDENSKNQNEIFEIGHSCFLKNERVFSQIESAHVFLDRITLRSKANKIILREFSFQIKKSIWR